MPHIQPPPEEIEEMSRRALEVVRLLEDLRRSNVSEGQAVAHPTTAAAAAITASGTSTAGVPMEQNSPGGGESSRPPKRPWEDTEQDEGAQGGGDVNGSQDVRVVLFLKLLTHCFLLLQQFSIVNPTTTATDGKVPLNNMSSSNNNINNNQQQQSTAEQDMELIRTKRATSTAAANGVTGQTKSKYRKRSVSPFLFCLPFRFLFALLFGKQKDCIVTDADPFFLVGVAACKSTRKMSLV